jgi:hypothetical protein
MNERTAFIHAIAGLPYFSCIRGRERRDVP